MLYNHIVSENRFDYNRSELQNDIKQRKWEKKIKTRDTNYDLRKEALGDHTFLLLKRITRIFDAFFWFLYAV